MCCIRACPTNCYLIDSNPILWPKGVAMKHFVSIIFCCLFIAACSSNPAAPARSVHFSAPSVELTLQQKLVRDNYPDQATLAALVQSNLESALQAQGALADQAETEALTVAVTMEYQRIFAGEATPLPSASVAPPRVSYKVVVKQGDSVVTTYEGR